MMKMNQPEAEFFVPDGLPLPEAMARTTHLAVAAHQDDLEIMSCSGILACFQQTDKWFSGAVVTDGAGSSRAGLYKDYTDAQMRLVRRKEQKKAAFVGEYGFQALLDYPSGPVKDPANKTVVEDILALLEASSPTVVYTHNLADKHDTHVGVALKTIAAIRRLPLAKRPRKLIGCEVWRDLDWMCDGDKVPLDATDHENLQAALLGVFDSQIAGGKRYDLATMGRRKAHATYFAAHDVDDTNGMNFAMDLTPLIASDNPPDPAAYVGEVMARFEADVRNRLTNIWGG
jgi:LmbE family N-acetylglucosaminyl deacetylase